MAAIDESPGSNEQVGMASLADLYDFLEGEVGRVDKDQHPPNVGEKGGNAHKQQPD